MPDAAADGAAGAAAPRRPVSAGGAAKARPSAGESAEALPSARESAKARPAAGESAKARPLAGESAEARPSAGESARARPSAGESAEARPSARLWAEARAFLALAVPMTVSRIGVAAMGIADGVMLSRHSAEQLAVLGQADALMARLLDVFMVLATAGLALAAQARAGGRATAHRVGRVWHHGLVLALAAGLLGLLFGLAGGPLLAALGQPPALVAQSGQVIRILSWGVFPALLALVSAGLLEALGRPIGVAVAVVLANGLNIGLNALLIHGHGSIPAMGAAGAAWSTTVVRWALALVLMAGVWWLSDHRRYAVRGRWDPVRAALPALPWRHWWRKGAEQRARGWAGAANVAVLALLSLGLPVMAGWLGTGAVAQVTALGLALSPVMVLAWGMGDAAGLRVAALQGAQPGGPAPARPAPRQPAPADGAPRAAKPAPADGAPRAAKPAAADGAPRAAKPTPPDGAPRAAMPTPPDGAPRAARPTPPDGAPRPAQPRPRPSSRSAPGHARATGHALAAVLLAVVLAVAALYGLAPVPMVRWAAHDPALLAAVLPLLPLGLAALVADALGILYSAMLRSLGVLRGPFILHAVTGALLLPLAWGLTFGLGWGVPGLLTAHMALAVARVLALAALYERHARRADLPRHRRPPSPANLSPSPA